jgi:hypothetical protein
VSGERGQGQVQIQNSADVDRVDTRVDRQIYEHAQELDEFNFDGKTFSRGPHLKLGDHTSPNEVGRVYFAMDSDGERFIVDHVGLKLYGL